MPKAKHTPSPEEQRKRFEEYVKSQINAGTFDPAEAEKVLEALVRGSRQKP